MWRDLVGAVTRSETTKKPRWAATLPLQLELHSRSKKVNHVHHENERKRSRWRGRASWNEAWNIYEYPPKTEQQTEKEITQNSRTRRKSTEHKHARTHRLRMIGWVKRLKAAFGASFLWLICLIYFTQVHILHLCLSLSLLFSLKGLLYTASLLGTVDLWIHDFGFLGRVVFG